MEDAVTSRLKHARVRVEAGVSQLGDLLREKLDAVGGVAENDRLVYLELGKEGIQAVNLLLFFNKGVVLSDTTERELVHKVDLIRIGHVLNRERLNGTRECSAEKHDLTVFWVELEEILDDWSKLWRQKLVSLVHDEHIAFAEIGDTLSSQILNSSWCANNDVDWVSQANDIVAKTSTTGGDHDVYAEVLAERLAYLRGLKRKFASWDKDETLDLGVLWVDLLKCRDGECCRLSGSVLCASKNVAAG